MKHFNLQNFLIKKINIFLFIFIIIFIKDITAQTGGWNYIGNSNISGSTANFQNLMLRGNVPYVVYQDWAQTGRKATVKKWNGTSWELVGGTAGITDNYPYYMSLASSSDSMIYMAYLGTSGVAKVMKFNGTAWSVVGSGITSAGAYWTNMGCDGATPIVAYQDQSFSSKAFVKKWDGTNWVNVPSALTTGISDGSADYIDMHISNDHNIFVAYKDGSASSKATVKKFNGTSWSTLGGTGFTSAKASILRMALFNNTPYIAYSTSTSDGGVNKVSVQKWNGTSWEFVGPENFTLELYYDFDIACGPDGTPYLTYDNNSNNCQRLMKFDGTNWVYIGSSTGYTGYSASYPSLKISTDNIPVCAFMDGNSSPQYTTSVMWYKDPVVLNAPAINATNVSTSPTFNWMKTNYSNYFLQVSMYYNYSTNAFADSTLTDTVKSITGLNSNQTYYWRVRGKHFYGWSTPQSSTWYFTTALPPPNPPTLSSPADNSTGISLTPTMQWLMSSGASSYRLQIGLDSAFTNKVIDSSLTSIAFVVPSGKLSNSTKYYWRVNATSSNGTGNWSTVRNFTTVAVVRINLTATSGTTSANYATLKDAFDAINAGTHKGSIDIKIISSLTETSSCVLNSSGSGSASYVSVNIYPTITGLSVTGNFGAPLIDLNGADYVTIDGRVNATGSTKDLIISNSSTLAGAMTIRYINDAVNNMLKYCTVKGSETDNSGGIIYFGTAGTGAGNNGNTVDNNNITNAGGNKPKNAIVGRGTAGKENSGNIISNNNFYDFITPVGSSCGIFLGTGNTNWTLTGNSFYETSSISPGDTYFIQIWNTGTNYTVSGNYIGGSAPLCAGTPLTKTSAGSSNSAFYGIYMSVGTTSSSYVNGNTFKNISWTNSGNANFYGIYVAAGSVSIGSYSAPNNIGSMNSTGSIVFTNGATGGQFRAIDVSSTGSINIINNKIGGITTATANATDGNEFFGIIYGQSAAYYVSGNTIGSSTVANSINLSSPSTSNSQRAYGIYSVGTTSVTISEDSVANITNGSTNAYISMTGTVTGIYAGNGSNNIANNVIRNLTIANNYASNSYDCSVAGISLINTATVAQYITSNIICNLSNTNAVSSQANVRGIFYNGGSTASTVSGNYIYGISMASINSSNFLDGIYVAGGTATYSNNIINITVNLPLVINGIIIAAGTNSLYFNTVYLGGTGSGYNSHAFWQMGASTNNLKNNVFMNNRSTGFAIRLTSNSSLVIDYNDYYAPNASLGYLGGYKNTLADWRLATGQDANSINLNPSFTSAGGTNATDYKPSASLFGTGGTGITTDYANTTRSLTSPIMGAWEVAVAPLAPVLLTPVTGSVGNALPLNIVWNKTTSATGYNAVIATDSLFTGIVVNDSTLTDSIKTVSGLSPLTKYYWKVRAKNTVGWGSYSSVFNFKTLGSPAVITLSLPANNSTGLPVSQTFKWLKAVDQTDGPEAIGFTYWYELATDAGFTSIVTRDSTLTDTAKSVTGLNNITDYYWRVKAKSVAGWGTFCTGWKFTTIVPVPNAPALVSPLNNSLNNLLNLNLVWNKTQYAAEYNVVVSTNVGFTNIILNDSTLTDSVKAITGLTNGTIYYWKVRAKDVAGWGSFSSVYNFTTLGAPSTVVLASPSNNAVNQLTNLSFNWFKANDNVPAYDPKAITNYWFDIASDSLFANIVARDSSLTDTTKSITGLNYLTGYFWRVKAKNPTGWGVFSSAWKLTTVPPAPVAPTLLTPANSSVDLSVTPVLDWNEVTYAASYRVQISTNASFTTTVYDSAGITLSTITIPSGKLNTNAQYYWRVSAANISGTSAYSAVWNFTTAPNAPNVPVLSLPANSAVGQPTTISFKWYKAIETLGDSPDAISKYWFEHSTDSTFATIIARDSSLTDTTKTLSGLNNITKYFWRVKAKNQSGWGNFSSIWNFTTIVPVPVAPVLSLPVNNSTGVILSPVLTWNSVTYAVSYRIQVSADSNFTTTQWDTLGVTGITTTIPAGKLTGLTKYYWRVNAVNSNGTGNWSEVWNFRTLQNLSLNLKVYLEGFWNGTTQVTDTVMVYLANTTTPYAKVDSAKVLLSSAGTALVNFTKAPNGTYHLIIKHRNHLETWSKLGQSFVTNVAVNYDFTSAVSQAFGDNMKQVGSVWVLYGGDANADGSIDANDIGIFITEFGNLGYLRSDFNGDEDVNAVDVLIISNNFGLIKITPGVEPLAPETLKNTRLKFDSKINSGLNINKVVSDKKTIVTDKKKVNNN